MRPRRIAFVLAAAALACAAGACDRSAGRIQSSILSDPGMAGSDVSVSAIHGVVSLTGNVASQEQVAIASAHAQREDGVMRVDNHLALNVQ